MPDLLGPNPWRPEGWVNTEDLPEDGPLDGLDDCGIYEAGADAMLEALKAGGVKVSCRTADCGTAECSLCPIHPNRSHVDDDVMGWLIFIPEAQP